MRRQPAAVRGFPVYGSAEPMRWMLHSEMFYESVPCGRDSAGFLYFKEGRSMVN